MTYFSTLLSLSKKLFSQFSATLLGLICFLSTPLNAALLETYTPAEIKIFMVRHPKFVGKYCLSSADIKNPKRVALFKKIKYVARLHNTSLLKGITSAPNAPDKNTDFLYFPWVTSVQSFETQGFVPPLYRAKHLKSLRISLDLINNGWFFYKKIEKEYTSSLPSLKALPSLKSIFLRCPKFITASQDPCKRILGYLARSSITHAAINFSGLNSSDAFQQLLQLQKIRFLNTLKIELAFFREDDCIPENAPEQLLPLIQRIDQVFLYTHKDLKDDGFSISSRSSLMSNFGLFLLKHFSSDKLTVLETDMSLFEQNLPFLSSYIQNSRKIVVCDKPDTHSLPFLYTALSQCNRMQEISLNAIYDIPLEAEILKNILKSCNSSLLSCFKCVTKTIGWVPVFLELPLTQQLKQLDLEFHVNPEDMLRVSSQLLAHDFPKLDFFRCNQDFFYFEKMDKNWGKNLEKVVFFSNTESQKGISYASLKYLSQLENIKSLTVTIGANTRPDSKIPWDTDALLHETLNTLKNSPCSTTLQFLDLTIQKIHLTIKDPLISSSWQDKKYFFPRLKRVKISIDSDIKEVVLRKIGSEI